MGELRLPGLATGIDTATLVDQLMVIESRKLANIQLEKTGMEEKSTALDELRTTINKVASAAGSLSDADNLVAFSVTSSDSDVLTLSTTPEANPGSHSIEINQLATGETWIQDVSTFEFKTDYVGAGTFIYSYGHKEVTITTAANETTLEDFVDLINNDENNPGVAASLLYQGGSYHLMLSGQETGEDHLISINASSTEVWQADTAFVLKSDGETNASKTTKIIEFEQFGDFDLESGEVIEITGTDRLGAAITQTDLALTEYTTLEHLLSKIETAFGDNVNARVENGKIIVTDKTSGVSSLAITLTYNANGSAATLTLPTMAVIKEGGATTESLATLDSSTFVQTQSAQNAEIRVDGFPPDTGVAEVQTLDLTQGNPNGGYYLLTYKGQTTGQLDYQADAATIQAALEALSTVNVGDITVTTEGPDGIDDGEVYLTFNSNLGDVDLVQVDGDPLTGNGNPQLGIVESTKGVRTDWITRNSNSVTDALGGVTLNLHDVTEANTPIKITINRNIGTVSKQVEAMVAAYNELITAIKEKTEYDTETKKLGLLSRDLGVSFVKSQMRDPFIGIIAGFADTFDSFIQARDLGITIDGAGMMQFDSADFMDAINEDYDGVLEVLGATKSGNSDSDIVSFYNGSDNYTTAGVYHVKVKVEDLGQGNVITEAYIKLASESTWRVATWSGTLITGNSEFDEDGNPMYPENGLQISVDTSQAGYFGDTTPIVMRVKQGVAGELEDLLKEVTETDGRLDISKEILSDRIDRLEKRIEKEEARLETVQDRLIAKFARLERILASVQRQMAAIGLTATPI